MALSPGTRLGHYEIAGLLGEGGMGEVYRALDTRLDRQVAIKILPESVAEDPDRLARFEREAKVLAALNHANIAAIYGIEERALVMELVEGPTLAERIALGPMPLAEVLPIARQIAEALEAAHEKGIIHRDLKPANVKVRSDGTVKVLDFGLAKAMDSGLAPGSSIHSPTMLATMTAVSTKVGMIMGTASYMSPEQARGAAVDRRADVWSFGVMLLEMLTGRMLFGGESVSDTLAAVLRDRIDLDRLPADTPHSLRRLLRRALDRDVKRRMTDMGAARLEIDEALAGEAAEPSATIATPERKSSRLPWVAAAIASLAALGLAAGWWRASRPVEQTPLRFNLELAASPMSSARNTVAISPDGTRLAFIKVGPENPPLVAMRLLEHQRDVLLQGTDGAAYPFFSPDGQWIGFGTTNGKLKKISIQGGAVTTICDAPNMRGAAWTEDDEIILSPDARNLMRVPAAGGTPQPVTKAGPNTQWERWPQILPGGKWVLFTEGTEGGGSLAAFSLKSGERKTVAPGARFGRYLSGGYLLYHSENTLMGVRFDPAAARVQGTPVPLLEDVAVGMLGAAQFDFSNTGTLVYIPGSSGTVGWPVSWLDGSGKIEPLLAKPDRYFTPQLSPDGKLLALAISSGSGQDVSVYDPARDTMTRISFTGKSNRYPIWAPDGRHMIFSSWEPYALWWVRADGAGQPQKLADLKGLAGAGSFTSGGKEFLYAEIGQETGYDIWRLALDLSDPEHPKAAKREAILNSPNGEVWPGVSPDGRWLVYGSNESGAYQVYVRPFSGGILGAGKWQISSASGTYPLWSRNGRELFYEVDGKIMVVDYAAKDDTFVAQKPRLWSDRQILAPEVHRHADLAPDGKRFVIFAPPAGANTAGLRVTLILNFSDEVRRRAGIK